MEEKDANQNVVTLSTEMVEKAIEEKKKLEASAAELAQEAKERSADKSEPTKDNQSENADIFITENDRFSVKISYYRNADNNLVVESVDNDFDANHPNLKSFTITLKYPSQGDYEAIINAGSNKSVDQLRYADIIQMELFRIAILMRSWSLPQEITRIAELDPSIVKGIVNKVREKIALKGIL